MPSSAWAQAVEAMRQADYHSVCGCCEQMHQPECYDAMLRAALPHLLRAVVEKLAAKDISWPGDTADMVVGLTYRGCKAYVDRASILSALIAAAERVAK